MLLSLEFLPASLRFWGAPDTCEGLWLAARPWGAERGSAAWQLGRWRSVRGPSQAVCVPVYACACTALTCRLLTEVFVCTQASELRGPPALPPLPSEPRPCLRHLSDLAVFHCLLPTDPAGLGPVPASLPSLPHAASWDSHGPLWTPSSPSGHMLGRLGAPTWTECQEGVAMKGIKTPSQSLPSGEHPASACATAATGPVCLPVCLSVCL